MKRRAAAQEAAFRQAVSRSARRLRARGARPDPAGEAGLSLVELLVSVTILSVGLLALASVGTASLLSLRDSSSRQSATEASAQILDLARDTSWADLANRTGDAAVAGATFDPDGPGCLAPETILRSANGPVTGSPYQVGPASPTAQLRTVRTYVTTVTALDCPPAPAVATPPPAPAKRVTVVVQWTSGGVVHTSRRSTLIAFSGRGAGIVRFDVAPATASVTGVPGVLCLSHTLTNQGVEDAYEIVAPPNLAPGVTFASYVDSNNDRVGDPSEVIGLSTGAVPFNGTLPLLFCYTVDEVNVIHTHQVVVRSVRASSQVETLDHTVDVDDTLTLYLHNPPNTANHQRDLTAVLQMDRVFPTAVTGSGAPPSSAGLMYDYDSNVDLLGYQGMALPRVPASVLPNPLPLSGNLNDYSSSYHGRWDYQVPWRLRVGGNVEVNLWTAPTAALGNPLNNLGLPLPPPVVPYALRYRLLHMTSSGTVLGVLAQSPEELVFGIPGFSPVYLHQSWGWQQTEWDFNVPGPVPVAIGDVLRLELVCDFLLSTSSCHLGHDTPAFASHIVVTLL